MPLTARVPRIARLALCTLAGPLIMTACSVDLDREPTPTAAPTEISFGPNDIAVGELLDRSEEAWGKVDAWTSEARTEQLAASESGAGGTVTTEQVLLPSTRRIVSSTEDTVVSEEIWIDGMVYMRGSRVATSIYPEVDADTWIAFLPESVPADTPLAQGVRYLTSEPTFPFDSVTVETRALPASPVGIVQIEGRTCTVYQFVKNDGASAAITYRIAFDDAWRPCELVMEAGGIVETTTWTYDSGDIQIHAPEDAVPVESFPTPT